MSDNPDDDDTAPADAWRPQTEAEKAGVSRIVKARLAQEKRSQAAAPRAPAVEPQTIAEIVAATVAAMQQPQQRPPAAAPTAPSKNVDAIDPRSGMTDVFQMSIAQLDQLGPYGVREIIDRNAAVGRAMSGAPRRPVIPGSGK